jgi:hypothetical protein
MGGNEISTLHVIFSCEKKTGILIFQVKINLFDVIKAIPMIKNYSYYFYKLKKTEVWAHGPDLSLEVSI